MTNRLVLATSTATAPMALASLLRDHFLSAIARGQSEIDWAGLARVIAENAGLGQAQSTPQ